MTAAAAYPHHLRITRPSTQGGVQDLDTGQWTPTPNAGPLTLYDGPADVQDRSRVIERGEDGTPTLRSTADAYPMDERVIPRLTRDDAAAVTWADGRTDAARVLGTRRIDGVIYLGQL